MNWDTLEGRWDQVKGKVREKWAKLTDDDLQLIGGWDPLESTCRHASLSIL